MQLILFRGDQSTLFQAIYLNQEYLIPVVVYLFVVFKTMAGIYIHIPYCKQACTYCDFHFSTSLQSMPLMIDCLKKEVELRKHELSVPVRSLYFGGGTPSIIHPEMISAICDELNRNFSMDLSEFTLECNPDDVTYDKLIAWKKIGIDRLSIGVQSFFDEHLKWMNRSHHAQQSEDCLKLAQSTGFRNITIDLIYGFSGLSDDQWLQNLAHTIRYNIPHISAYALTIEHKTALGYNFRSGKYTAMEDEKVNHQFNILMDFLDHHGFEHYEISNFAQPGFRAVHNFNYWNNIPYLGIGPGAHSYLLDHRTENIGHNIKYIKAIQQKSLPSTIEVLSEKDRYNEYVMVSLRTSEGISIDYIRQHHPDHYEHFQREIKAFLDSFVTSTKGNYRLTREGKHLADYIASSLFIT